MFAEGAVTLNVQLIIHVIRTPSESSLRNSIDRIYIIFSRDKTRSSFPFFLSALRIHQLKQDQPAELTSMPFSGFQLLF